MDGVRLLQTKGGSNMTGGIPITEQEREEYRLAKEERNAIEGEIMSSGVNLNRNRRSEQEVIKAIPGTGGIVSTLAARLGVEWHTAKKYLSQYPIAEEAYLAECETINDRAETVVINSINSGHVGNAKWWLSRKRRDKFSTKQEIEYSGDVDLRRLTDAELESIVTNEGGGGIRASEKGES